MIGSVKFSSEIHGDRTTYSETRQLPSRYLAEYDDNEEVHTLWVEVPIYEDKDQKYPYKYVVIPVDEKGTKQKVELGCMTMSLPSFTWTAQRNPLLGSGLPEQEYDKMAASDDEPPKVEEVKPKKEKKPTVKKPEPKTFDKRLKTLESTVETIEKELNSVKQVLTRASEALHP